MVVEYNPAWIMVGMWPTFSLKRFEKARAGGGERLGSRVRPRQSEDLMAGVDEFRDNGRTDKAGRAGEEYAHGSLQGCVETDIG
jgi:hypothetical protein